MALSLSNLKVNDQFNLYLTNILEKSPDQSLKK